MTVLRPSQLPPGSSANPAGSIPIDQGSTVEKVTPKQVVDSGRPLATQVAAETGASNDDLMSSLRVSQAIDALGVSASSLASASGAPMVGYDRNVTGSVLRTAEEKFNDILNAADFGVKADGVTDDTLALQAAINYQAANRIDKLILPAGEIKLSGDVTVPTHSLIGSNYMTQTVIEGVGGGVNGSWLHFDTGSLIVEASSHSLRDFRVTSDADDGIIIQPSSVPAYPARSEMRNVRAEFCGGSGIVNSDNWLYLMVNIYARQNDNFGIEGRNGAGTGLACNSWTIIGGEIQGNGTIGGAPLGNGGTLKSTGGGVATGRSVQLNLIGVSIEGNKSDGLLIGEQCRGLVLEGCYFEKNGSHPDDRDIRNDIPSSSTVGPNSVVATNCNFTPQAQNGTSMAHSIEIYDCIDLKIINPQFYALSGPIIYTAEPIRIRETLAGRATGWVEGGWYSSSLYTQAFLKNEANRYGFPKKHVFSTNHVMANDVLANTGSGPFVIPIPPTAAYQVDANIVTAAGTWDGGSASGGATGVARIVTTMRRGMTGTTVSVKTNDINYVSSVTAIETKNNTSLSTFPGTFALITVARDGGHANDTLTSDATLLALEIVTYEGVISADVI